MPFVNGNFQFHCKSEHKQVKWNKITPDMCKSDSIFPYLQSTALLNLFRNYEIYFLIRFVWKVNNNNSWETVSFISFHSVNVKRNWAHLKEKNSWPGPKINTIFRQSFKLYYHKNILKVEWWVRRCELWVDILLKLIYELRVNFYELEF